MAVMAEVFGYLPHFNLIALYLKTVEKNIIFFLGSFLYTNVNIIIKKRQDFSGTIATYTKARNKQESNQHLSCSSVSFDTRFMLKINVFKFSFPLDLWLLDNVNDVSPRGQNMQLLLFTKYFLFP